MTAEDAFVHSILANPDDDLPRLVFADWLEENGRESHAELIRVQCELAHMPQRSKQAAVNARRKKLAAREKVLLAQPEFQATWPRGVGKPPYEVPGRKTDPERKYVRGFMPLAEVWDGELLDSKWKASPWNRLLREGKLLALKIDPGQGGFHAECDYTGYYEMEDLAAHPALCRVTKLHLFEADVSTDNLGVLARSPLLTQLCEVWLGVCTIQPAAFEALVTSSSVTRLRTLIVDAFRIAGGRETAKKDVRLWELVAASSNMVSLDRLLIDDWHPPTRKAVEALIRSPYLKTSLRLDVGIDGELQPSGMRWSFDHLPPAVVKAFRERFPECRFSAAPHG